MDLLLQDRTAIVTGGASNIGRQVVLTLAEEGANVAIFDLDEPGAQRVAQHAASSLRDNRTVAYRADITAPDQVEAAVQRAIGEFGKVDILVNVAGWWSRALFLDESRDKQEKVVNINLWGPTNVIRAVLPHMVERNYGRVVSVSSDAGRMGEHQQAMYSAAKAGVIALTKALAREVGRYNITLNCVCPGATIPADQDAMSAESAWHGQLAYWTAERQEKAARGYALRRLGTPQDMANMVVFLASERANYITGQTVSVSGGYTMM